MRKRQLKKNRYCPHCNGLLKHSTVKGGYAYECTRCDEDFYKFETKKA